MRAVPELRVRVARDAPLKRDGEYVVYWMTSARRGPWNFALQHAVARASELRRPLVVLEALRCDYRWASARMHRFVIDGMADNQAWFAQRGVAYHAYVEPQRGAGKGLLTAFAKRAALVVADEYPCFFLPRMLAAAASSIDARIEVVDGNGLLPLRAAPSEFATAYAFRRFLQKHLAPHLSELPVADALQGAKLPKLAVFPEAIVRRWPVTSSGVLTGDLAALPIDHDVAAIEQRGGATEAARVLRRFLDRKLVDYERRNEPEGDFTSRASAYLHFGHLSAHQVFNELMLREEWTPQRLASTTNGRREGWWNVSASAEGFLDQLVTWRELGFNFCHFREDYASFDALPEWALATLAKHANDEREHVYSLHEFETARTHDALWNAAQTQLAREGYIHNYLRMLWGKKILEWSRTPREALATLIELNNKYAVDGRDPNSYSGIFWCLGRFDRPWPERAIYGTVRSMSSQNTARKHDVDAYVRKYSAVRGAQRSMF